MTRRLDPRFAAAFAVLLVGGVLLGILTLGRLHYPVFPSLQERPDPAIPGLIAYLRYEESSGGGRACVWVVPASGMEEPRQLTCDRDLGGPVRWVPQGIAVQTRTGTRFFDPVTGELRGGTTAMGDQLEHPPEAGSPEARTHDGVTLLPRSDTPGRAELWLEQADGPQIRVASAEGPRDYAWWDAVWAPGGRWAAVQDSAQRLLIVDTEGGAVRLLAEDAGQPVWGEWRRAERVGPSPAHPAES